MAIAIQLPMLSPTMSEGRITKWLKKEGDKLTSGTAIAECETDKSNLEIEVYDDGTLLKILVPAGQSAPIGATIAWIGRPGEAIPETPAPAVKAVTAPAPAPVAGGPQAAPASAKAATAPAAPEPTRVAPVREAAVPVVQAPQRPQPAASGSEPQVAAHAPAAAARTPETSPASTGRVRASPLARRMAADGGVDLRLVKGSGPQGRIVRRDVEAAASEGAGAAPRTPLATAAGQARGRQAPTALPLTQMRKVIAQRLSEMKPGVPHFYQSVELEMDAALALKDEAKAAELKVSVNDIVVKAVAVAVRRFPRINQVFMGDRIDQLHTVDVGVAVAIDDGLITPVIRDADVKTVGEIADEIRALAERAKKKALKPEEYTGGSITVSNLGMFGIDSFVAVINPPQAAILAIGKVQPKVVVRDGQMVIRQMASVTLSGDHRVIDGAVGALFLQELRALLEHPLRLLL